MVKFITIPDGEGNTVLISVDRIRWARHIGESDPERKSLDRQTSESRLPRVLSQVMFDDGTSMVTPAGIDRLIQALAG